MVHCRRSQRNKKEDKAMKLINPILALSIWIYTALAVDSGIGTALLSSEQHPSLKSDALHNQHKLSTVNNESRQLYDSKSRRFLNLFIKKTPGKTKEKKVNSFGSFYNTYIFYACAYFHLLQIQFNRRSPLKRRRKQTRRR